MKKKNSEKVSAKAKNLFKGFFNKATGVIFSSVTSVIEETTDILNRGLQEVKDIREKIEDKIEEKLEAPDPLLIMRRASNPHNLKKSITGTNKISKNKDKGKEKLEEDEDEGEVIASISEYKKMSKEEMIKQLIADIHTAEELKNNKNTDVEDKLPRLPTQTIMDQLTAAHAGLKNGLEFTPEELKKLKKNPEGLKTASSTPQGSPRQSLYYQDKEDNKIDSTSITKTYSRFKPKPAELKKTKEGISSLIQPFKGENKNAKDTIKSESNNKDPDREDTCTLNFEQVCGGKLEPLVIEFSELDAAEQSFVNDNNSDIDDDNSEFGDDFVPENSSQIVQMIPAEATNEEPKEEIIYPEDSKNVFEYLTLTDITNGSVILKPTQPIVKKQTTNEYNPVIGNNEDEIDWTIKFKLVIEEIKAGVPKLNKKIENPKAKLEQMLSIIEEKTALAQIPIEETKELGLGIIPEGE